MDPVCGMSVEPATALEKGLHSDYKDTDYYFCGKGCKLEFRRGPGALPGPRARPIDVTRVDASRGTPHGTGILPAALEATSREVDRISG